MKKYSPYFVLMSVNVILIIANYMIQVLLHHPSITKMLLASLFLGIANGIAVTNINLRFKFHISKVRTWLACITISITAQLISFLAYMLYSGSIIKYGDDWAIGIMVYLITISIVATTSSYWLFYGFMKLKDRGLK